MSRSYKKNPYYSDGKCGTTKTKKRIANHRVRNSEDVPSGGAYKKFFPSWDIHDYINRWTWEEAKEEWEHSDDDTYIKRHYPTLKEFYRYWFKISKAK